MFSSRSRAQTDVESGVGTANSERGTAASTYPESKGRQTTLDDFLKELNKSGKEVTEAYSGLIGYSSTYQTRKGSSPSSVPPETILNEDEASKVNELCATPFISDNLEFVRPHFPGLTLPIPRSAFSASSCIEYDEETGYGTTYMPPTSTSNDPAFDQTRQTSSTRLSISSVTESAGRAGRNLLNALWGDDESRSILPK
ncbi:hypothetical protein IAT40_004478 [Kwoniella sp. CBS 6097]